MIVTRSLIHTRQAIRPARCRLGRVSCWSSGGWPRTGQVSCCCWPGRAAWTGSDCGRSRTAAMSRGVWSGSCCSPGERVVRVVAASDCAGTLVVAAGWASLIGSTRSPPPAPPCAEPGLPAARLEGAERELALLVDYREQLVAERTRSASRLRWLLHELELGLQIPAGGARPPLLAAAARAGRWPHSPKRRSILISRALLARLRELREQINSLERQLEPLVETLAAAAADPTRLRTAHRLPRSSARSPASSASPTRANSPRYAGCRPARGLLRQPTPPPPQPAPATDNSTAPTTAWPSPKDASTHPPAPTSPAANKKEKPAAKPSAASNATSSASSTAPSTKPPQQQPRRPQT